MGIMSDKIKILHEIVNKHWLTLKLQQGIDWTICHPHWQIWLEGTSVYIDLWFGDCGSIQIIYSGLGCNR